MANASKNHKGGNSAGGVGTICNGRELSRILGVGHNSVTRYAKSGMPIYDNNGVRNAPRYDSAACIRWLRDREVMKINTDDPDQLDIDEIRRRTELAKMKKEEISLAVDEERYGDIEAIIEELGHSLSTIRANLMSLPKLASQLEHQESVEIEKILEEETYRMLEELSDFEIEDHE